MITTVKLHKNYYHTKINSIKKEILNHDKYVTTNDFNKYLGAIVDERLKWAKLATSNDFDTGKQNRIAIK